MIRLTLLAGTVLPALVLAGPMQARSLEADVGTRMHLAQLDEPGGPRGGGGRGPGGPGGAERGGAERGGPERGGGAERGPRERPEPREAPAARERPSRPEPQERAAPPAARERPDRSERPEPRQAPAARERQEQPQRQERPEKQEQPQRQEQPSRQERPQRQEAPAAREPAARERPEAPNRPDRTAPAQREDREPTRRGRDTDRDNDRTPDRNPAQQRQERTPDQRTPDQRTPDRTPDRGQDRDGDGRPDRAGRPSANEPARTAPTQPGAPAATQPGATPPTAPNQRPGVPGRPVQAPNATQTGTPPAAQPDAGQRGQQPAGPNRSNAPDAAPSQSAPPNAPNQRPGVPGRPVQAPDATPPAAQPNAVPPGQPAQPLNQGQPAAPNAAQPPAVAPGAPNQPGFQQNGVGQPNAQQQQNQFQRDRSDGDRRDRFNVPGRPGYIEGGFRSDDYEYRDFDRVRRERREYDVDGRSYYREPGRIIVRDRDGYFIRHDETERFRYLDQRGFRSERRGRETFSYLDRPGGEQIVTVVDDDGRMLRRSRRFRDGREVVIIDKSYGPGGPRPIYEDVVDLPPPDIRIPRDRYIVDYGRADARAVYGALTAPPVVAIDRRYTLDQVRYSPQLRARMPSVDINTINFESGSFTIEADQARQLQVIADGINQAIKANPQEVFLIEGYTDAVGADVDNLSLSDRRAQSVATVLTQTFNVPPENLTTQGYGEQYLKVNTQEANRENRRVTVRRITPLLQQQSEVDQSQTPPPPR